MEINEISKKVMVGFMTICVKINEMDDTIAEDIKDMNDMAADMIPGQADTIEETILTNVRTHAAKGSSDFETFIKAHLGNMRFLDQAYIRNMMVLDATFGSVPTYALQTLLNAPAPSFNKKEKEFHFYHTISNRAIQTGNSDLIRQAIERVQSLK